jgi:hypothetical protein
MLVLRQPGCYLGKAALTRNRTDVNTQRCLRPHTLVDEAARPHVESLSSLVARSVAGRSRVQYRLLLHLTSQLELSGGLGLGDKFSGITVSQAAPLYMP